VSVLFFLVAAGILTSGDFHPEAECAWENERKGRAGSTAALLRVPQRLADARKKVAVIREQAWENEGQQKTTTQQLFGPDCCLGSQDHCCSYQKVRLKRRSTKSKRFICLKLPSALVIQGCVVLESYQLPTAINYPFLHPVLAKTSDTCPGPFCAMWVAQELTQKMHLRQ